MYIQVCVCGVFFLHRRPFRLPLSKADRLMEGQTLLYGGTFMTLETGQPDIDLSSTQTSRKEETVVDDDNDSYKQVFISSVYSMHSSEKVKFFSFYFTFTYHWCSCHSKVEY